MTHDPDLVPPSLRALFDRAARSGEVPDDAVIVSALSAPRPADDGEDEWTRPTADVVDEIQWKRPRRP